MKHFGDSRRARLLQNLSGTVLDRPTIPDDEPDQPTDHEGPDHVFLMADLSHWNDDPPRPARFTPEDFEAAGTVINAVMLKASQGDSYVDPQFFDNVRWANLAGMPWGAYHFVEASDGRVQAAHFHETVMRADPGCVFFMIDWEAGGRQVALNLRDGLRPLVGIKRVGDYIGAHAREQGGQLEAMDFHVVPEYGVPAVKPQYRTDPLSAWQYTDGEQNGTDLPSSIPGFGPCDVSIVYEPAHLGLEIDMLTDADISRLMDWRIRPDGLKIGQALRDANVARQQAELAVAAVGAIAKGLEVLPQNIVDLLPVAEPGAVLTEEQVKAACALAIRQTLGGLDAS